MIDVKTLLPFDNQGFPCLVLHERCTIPVIVPRLCHAAIVNQWMITDLKGSDRKSGQAACFIQLVLHKFCVAEYFL